MLERNELSSHKQTLKKLKWILLSKLSQSERFIYCIIPTIRHSRKGKTIETIKRSMIPVAVGKRGWSSRVQKIFKVVKLFWKMIIMIHVLMHLSNPYNVLHQEWSLNIKSVVDNEVFVYIHCNKHTMAVQNLTVGRMCMFGKSMYAGTL